MNKEIRVTEVTMGGVSYKKGDEQLMREALKTLERLARDLGVQRERYSEPLGYTKRTREVIADLQERLLRE